MVNERDNKEVAGGAPYMRKYAYHGENILRDLKEKYGYEGPLGQIFAENQGPIVHKWLHYIPIYEQHFSRFRGKRFRMLEIGVSKGGSLQMWRKYFGEDATIFGVDIDPDCAQFDGEAANVRIGSQTDEAFMRGVIDEMGGVDLILDDGSHVMTHIRKTLSFLFPLLENQGIYFIEDLHTAYWQGWRGGLGERLNLFNLLRPISDDMHHWYHQGRMRIPAIGTDLHSVSVYDSILVLEKRSQIAPAHVKIGSPDK